MFYGISWHHCVLNVPWRVQNCHPRFFVIGAHWPWYSICNYLCNNILLLWLWLQRPRAGERSIIADCTPGCCTSPHRQPQHANTSKLSNLLRNIQNIINTVWCSLLMRRELKSAETWVDGKTWYKTLCYWLMSQWIQQSANSRQFYIKFSRPLEFQQIWARDSSVVVSVSSCTYFIGQMELKIFVLFFWRLP